MVKGLTREAVATAAGLTTLLGLSVASFPLVISGAGALGIYVGTKMLLTKVDRNIAHLPEKVKIDLQDILHLLDKINSQQKRIQDTTLNTKIKKLIHLGEQIVDVLISDESSYNRIREVENIFVSLHKILAKYLDVQEHANLGVNLDKTKQKLQNLLDSLGDALKGFYQKAVAGDLLDLDVDIKVLQRIVDSRNQV